MDMLVLVFGFSLLASWGVHDFQTVTLCCQPLVNMLIYSPWRSCWRSLLCLCASQST